MVTPTMKFAVAALLATAVLANDNITDKFMKYLAKHGKSYLTVEEFEARKELFTFAENFINNHNSHTTSFTLGHNKFSDMSTEEKAAYRGRVDIPKMRKYGAKKVTLPTDDLPDSVDWRGTAVNAIRDQGQCGSCWAFSSVASMEGVHAVTSGDLLQFAEQQLVDCAFLSYGNLGCGGGLEENAFTYYESHAAIARDLYDYTASRGTCQDGTLENTGVMALSYTDVTVNDSAQVMAAIAQHPISVAIEADKFVFQAYSGGIFDSASCGTNLDHAVALVGYGTEGGQDYYILRNSWGTSWGEDGYMRIANNGDGAGICGVQSAATYPTTN